ncbi:MAG: hypothetical protein LN575_01945 [Rickettsia endosymbiont of Gnoriste bilineata]|nr:hypothetical protein [Rickettsia endosymbiont of Gnoriste bilineata]
MENLVLGAMPISNRRATSNDVTNFSSLTIDANLPWLNASRVSYIIFFTITLSVRYNCCIVKYH